MAFSNQHSQLASRTSRLPHGVLSLLVPALLLLVGLGTFAEGQTLRVLHSFSLGEGTNPIKGLVRDAAGNLYGITPYGGILDENCDPEFGGGTVFKLDPAGRFSVLHAFDNRGDGCGPLSLIEDAAGNFYGTTTWNFNSVTSTYGGGTVFKIDSTGKFRVLYTFPSTADGSSPNGLIRDVQGNLFGTTQLGGDVSCDSGKGCGTAFQLNAKGKESVLYNFTASPDGFQPQSGLVRDAAASGNFYGTTTNGGDLACQNGCGTVFKVNKPGIETVLYKFTGGVDGANPLIGALLYVFPGALYGTASTGGDLSCFGGLGCGVVFEVETDGKETVLHTFHGTDGSSPVGGLIRDGVGNFYGTTEGGGKYGYGTVFKLDPAGNLTVLHDFNSAEGSLPWAGLIRDSAGNLYGTTQAGGSNGYGTVFEITP